jgi:translation initiation factor eIF-2B subunit epsilon
MDLAKGQTVPFDPSINLERGQTFSKKSNGYREKDVKIEKSAHVKNGVIGSKSIVGDGAVVFNSIIGRNCTIQAGAVIRESILWDNVVVESGVKLHQAIVTDDNTLKADFDIAERVVLPRKANIPAGSKIGGTKTFTVYGNDAKPIINEDEDEDEDEEDLISIRTLNQTNLT